MPMTNVLPRPRREPQSDGDDSTDVTATPTQDGSTGRAGTPWDRLPDGARGAAGAVAIFLASRVVVLVTLAVATFIVPEVTLNEVLFPWDAGWYVKIIGGGYPSELPTGTGPEAQSHIAFFPLFPMAARAVHLAFGVSPLAAGVAMSVSFGATAAVAVWLVVREVADVAAAYRAVVLFVFYPASMALLAPFSEGLAISLSAACLLFLIRRRWWAAGVAAALATATRPTAIALVLCCAWAAFQAIRARREWRSLAAVVLAPMGMVLYFAYLWAHTGSLTAWFYVEDRGWGQGTDFGRATIDAIRTVVRSPSSDVNALACTAATVFAVVGLVALARWRPPSVLTVYALGICFIALTSQLVSRPRYLFSAFPLIAALAVLARRPPVFATCVGLSATLLGAYTLLSVLTPYAVF